MHVDDVEAIVKVLAEPPLCDGLFQIAMRGGHDAHVHLGRFLCAEAHEFAILQNLQQLGLQLKIHVADFVEQDGAAVGDPEVAPSILERARDGASP